MAKVQDLTSAFTQSWSSRIQRNMRDVGEVVKESIVSLINNDSPPHSSIGEPPHIDVEYRHEINHPDDPHLVDSWTVEPHGVALSVSVVSSVPWSWQTEFGINMSGPRPYAVQSLEKVRTDLRTEFVKALTQ